MISKKSILPLILLFVFAEILPSLAQNYDESKVRSFILPDVLKSSNDQKVRTVKEWETIRRPEILSLFEEYVYGKMPSGYDKIEYRITRLDSSAMEGKAILKEVEIKVTQRSESVKINVVMFVPQKTIGPVPVFLLINNRSTRNTLASRDTISGFWPAEQVIESGYAMAAFHYSDAAPDNVQTYKNGVLRIYPELAAADNGMKAIGSWAWAASRVMDYFQIDRDLAANKISVVGHSRGGKAALWAAAQDKRFAMCFSNCSGNTGAAISRRNFGETVARINITFPHWFNNNYKKYNDNVNALPVDQHMLISLIAPRPVYTTNASEDLWADPTGSYLSLKKAAPVFALYGETSTLPQTAPALDTPLLQPPLGYHNRTGQHDLTFYDWKQFVRFANVYYGN
ncbi:acetylxylan esterase [Dyadobacter sp. CY356]|uniref:glucuronyl esterase domain-containing protein n=1 Tax=Dyadobacter sp. CY356 TaxID=2906442 RepID=UPI001F2737D4|nr:acetylxylan esterase [Dyadobacter sp. CY356]MCF0054773.1 acetylxylan esterase [Dyadobacter sp. CY356]